MTNMDFYYKCGSRYDQISKYYFSLVFLLKYAIDDYSGFKGNENFVLAIKKNNQMIDIFSYSSVIETPNT